MSWLRIAAMSDAARRRLKSMLLLGVFVSVLGLATSATLHKAVHPNAQNADHQCAVTLLASGQVHTAASTVALPTVSFVTVAVAHLEISRPTGPSFNLSPSRGPPALLS